ncbi:protein phosphatase Slingshot homolog 2 isoform X2 [Candoia aspera]|uniref:protein phosphatase Slingshot homolog 2 isoform X2 n=1 Tax=Candoia aspera TaxID=51853 RepID=UPI002FD7D785
MALVTVQRSPTPSATSSPCASEADSGEDDCRFQPRSISESFLTVKGAALFLPRGNGSSAPRVSHRRNKHAGDLQQHLQAMFMLLRPEDYIRLAVRLESTYQNRTRYMVVVSTNGRQDTEESIVLGVDFSSNDSTVCTMGLVLPLWSDALIHLDGDGGFSVSTDNRIHIFKPVSVQAMWSALQSLHKACEVARIHNYYPGSLFLTWVSYYESHINSDQSSVNEWNAMQDVQSHRPDSPALFTDVPTERERTERLIKTKLREIMMQKDLENITSKEIRTELEMQMACNLREFKGFIDNEMIVILGQMDSPTQIFDHVLLGSEWNASNLEDLQTRGVRYILNVTREIDNFFPGVFEYHNIRVYDEEATDLLAYWNDTYKFISKARKNGSKCLVHCKMGVSRSASTVIAYAMKEYGWNLDRAYDYVKERRTVTKPNPSFMRQLEEYQGILLASKQRHNKLWRSHSDSDLSDHHEPIGKSGMEVSKKEITTSADRISENKSPSSHVALPAGLPAGPHRPLLCHLGPGPVGSLSGQERVILLEVAPRDFSAEQMEDQLNLNNINGCPSGCCPGDAKSPLDNCHASGALLQREGALDPASGFPGLAVDDLENDALKPGDGNVHLVPMEELASCLQDTPSPPPDLSQPEEEEEEEEEEAEAAAGDFGTDRIDFFSALEKFVELSQENRPRASSSSRAEEPGNGRNGPPRTSELELLPPDPTEQAQQSASAGSSPPVSEASSLEEEQPKLSEPEHPVGLIRSHSPVVSVKEIVTEIESIQQGGGQGPAKAEATSNPVPVPKKAPLHEVPAEAICPWENKLGKKGEEGGEGAGPVPREAAQEPSKPDPEGALVPPAPSPRPDVEGRGLAEDPAEGQALPGPKWCPGSVRRATLELEERLRQEQQDLQLAPPVALFPARKNSRNEPPGADLAGRGKQEEPPPELAQPLRVKEASRAGSSVGPGASSEQPAEPSRPPDGPAEAAGSAREHRMVLWMDSEEGSPLFSPLPKRIEIIEFTHALPGLPGTVGGEKGGAAQAPEKAVDENCNNAFCLEGPRGSSELSSAPEQDGGPFERAPFSWGSPEEEEEEERETGAPADPAAPSPPASWVRCSPPPRLHRQHLVGLEGVTQGSTSTEPEPAPSGGYAGNGQFSLEERGMGFLPWTRWGPNPREAPPEGPGAHPLGCPLPRRSSCDGAKDSSQGTGLVKQLAKDLEACLRQAGLTPPSQMKRSASLAKLDCLGSLKDDLPGGCCLPAGASPASLESLRGPPGPALGPAVPSSTLPSPRPARHFVEPVKMQESLALSQPVERPSAQYARDFAPTFPPAEGTWTWAQLATLPQNPPARTRLPRRLKKSNERRRTPNPVYNTM